jgi:PAS domain S-box-containing protein
VRAVLLRWFLPFIVGMVLLSDLLTNRTVAAHASAVRWVLAGFVTALIAAGVTWYLARFIGGRLDRAEREMLRLSRLYNVLSQTNQAIARAQGPQALFAEACRIAVEAGGFEMAWVGIVDPATHLVRPAASYGSAGAYLDGIRISIDDVPEGRGPTGTALREGRPFLCRDIANDAAMGPWRTRALAVGFRSSAAFPLSTLGEVSAAYSIYAREAGWFTDEQVALLRELTSDISHALGGLEKERRRLVAEERSAASEMRFRSLIENSSDLITILDSDTVIRYQSPSVTRLLGYEADELVGSRVPDLIHADDVGRVVDTLRDAFATGQSRQTIVYRFRHKDGSWRVLESVGSSMVEDAGVPGLVINSRDITDRQTLEAQLRQAQKMEAVGLLAGGIAHDFNNLLTVVLANADLVVAALPDRPEIAEELHDLQAAARRGQAMIRNLMGFSRQGGVESVPVALGALGRNLTETLRRVLPETVEIRFAAAEPLPSVLADPGAIEQMLLNLATNARDAMPDGGTLRLEVARERVGEAAREETPWLAPGDYVVITVADTGTGMDEETRRRIFEPFFTTKPAGKGTGLGMPMVYGLMKQQAGYVVVDSAPGRGTTVRLFFPEAQVAAREVPPPAHSHRADREGGGRTILVVEDEEALRRAARRILERAGYRVLVAEDGAEALALLADRRGEVDLVFTDMIMPRLGGRGLYDRVQSEIGPVRFLVASGYAGRDVREDHGLPPQVPFINKPWTLEELVTRVREVLEAPPGP